MDFKDRIITEIDRYCSETGLHPSTVSTLAANDGKLYKSIKSGADVTTKRYSKIMDWFKANPPSAHPKKERKQ